MAIYHLSMKLFSRKDNRSSTKAAAYRSASKIEDERTNEIYDYTRKRGVIYTEIVMPTSESISWTPTRSELWNAVEMKNKREDSVVCREVEIALPVELTDEQRRELTQNFAHEIADKYEIGVDISIHKPDSGSKNYHAHLLITTNRIEGKGLGNKTRELDSIATRQVDKTSQNATEYLRGRWEKLANEKLRSVGHDVSIDSRTLEEQGIDREATRHEGKAVTAMERKKKNKIKTRIHAENERRIQEDQARHEAVSGEWQRIEDGIDREYAAAEVKAIEAIELRRLADEAEEAARQKKLEEEAEAELKAKELERDREKIAAEHTRKRQVAEPVSDLGFGEFVQNRWRVAGNEFVLKNKPVGGFGANTPPQPVKIYGYEAVSHDDGTIFYHPKGKPSEVAFVDKGASLELYENSNKAIVELLNLSAKKWPDGFELTGSEEFRARAEVLAEKWGVGDKIKNPLIPIPKVEPVITPPTLPIGEVMMIGDDNIPVEFSSRIHYRFESDGQGNPQFVDDEKEPSFVMATAEIDGELFSIYVSKDGINERESVLLTEDDHESYQEINFKLQILAQERLIDLLNGCVPIKAQEYGEAYGLDKEYIDSLIEKTIVRRELDNQERIYVEMELPTIEKKQEGQTTQDIEERVSEPEIVRKREEPEPPRKVIYRGR